MNNSEETVTCNREKALKRKQREPVYEVYGAGGRSIRVYPYKCVIYSGVTAGSLSINNAAGSEMTIYYKDVVGIRYKRSGAAIGYLRFETASGVEELLKLIEGTDPDDVFCIGGAEIYRLLLPYCDKALITRIDHVYDADAFLPDLDEDPAWKLVEESDEQVFFDLTYHFCTYQNTAV